MRLARRAARRADRRELARDRFAAGQRREARPIDRKRNDRPIRGEPGALAGASRLLATPGLVVLFEHNTKALESAGFARGAVTGLLTGLGFHLFELNESTGKLRPFDPSSRDFCNCAAVRSIPAILAPLVTA